MNNNFIPVGNSFYDRLMSFSRSESSDGTSGMDDSTPFMMGGSPSKMESVPASIYEGLSGLSKTPESIKREFSLKAEHIVPRGLSPEVDMVEDEQGPSKVEEQQVPSLNNAIIVATTVSHSGRTVVRINYKMMHTDGRSSAE